MANRPFQHLLIFIHALGCGGAERVVANMANHWAVSGLQVTVVTLAPETRDFYELHPNVRRIVLNKDYTSKNSLAAVWNNLRQVLAVRQVLREEKPEIALAMLSKPNVWLALAAMGMHNIACIGSERTHPPKRSLGRAWEFLRARLYGQLSAMTAPTEQTAAWLRKHTTSIRVEAIPNALSWPLPALLPAVPPPATKSDERLLLAVGRLCEAKGFDILIAAFARLTNDFPQWKLIIAGDGALRTALQAKIDATGQAERIQLVGRVGNLSEWYEAADAYVMSSRVEGFGNTLVEAMAHGLPAVSFDCDTGPRDIITHEVDGLLVPAGDGAALELALRRLLGDEALRQRLGVKAMRVRERYSVEVVAKRWEALFESVRK